MRGLIYFVCCTSFLCGRRGESCIVGEAIHTPHTILLSLIMYCQHYAQMKIRAKGVKHAGTAADVKELVECYNIAE